MKSLKQKIKECIEKEKNIEIRKRTESRIRKKMDLLFVILMGSSIYANIKYSFSGVILAIVIIITLLVYLFFETKYISEYADYTDKLIRELNPT